MTQAGVHAPSSSTSSHRYGKTVALDDVTHRHPVRPHDRGDRSGRRRQVDPARARSPGCARSSRAASRCFGGDIGDKAHRDGAGVRASPICRRAWAAISTRRCRSSRTSTSSAGCSARTKPSAGSRIDELLKATEPRPLREPAGRQAFRRHEAEARPLLRADPRSGPAHPRRADHRRRSALARPVLGPDRHASAAAGRR